MLTVIVVDDQPVNCIVLKAMLEQLGARVLEAGGGAEGLALLNSTPCDVLLFDVHMPGLDGLEMVRRMRAGSGPNKETVSVAVTADTFIPFEHMASYGADGILEKPITMAAVSKALGMSRRPPGAVGGERSGRAG